MFAILASTLVLFGQLSALVHIALVRHVLCVAHGELVHAHAAHQVDTSFASTQGEVSVAVEHGHDHDRCGFVATQNTADDGHGMTASVLPAREHVRVASHVHDARAIVAIDLLLLAPKSSPPV